jgi:protein involved in polysaccharide export with SLBB domain
MFSAVEDEIPLKRISPAQETEIQLTAAEHEESAEIVVPEVASTEPAVTSPPARLALPSAGSAKTAPAVDSAVQPVIHHPPTSTLVTAPGPLAASTKVQHIIQIGDELDIAFPYQPVIGDATAQRLQPPLFRTERVIVREDGMVVLPLIDPVMAAGLTPEEVRSELMEAYLPFQYDPLSNLKSGVDRQYRICVNDEIDIRVRNQPDLDDVVTVRPDGKISVARVGSVVVEGKTIDEIEKELSDAIAKVVAQPEVSVSLRQFHADIYYEGGTMKRIGLKNLEGISVIVRTAERRVFVMGEVKGAGQVPYRGTLTLNQALASAGGPLRTAKLKEVKIVRQTGPQQPPRTILIDLRSTIRGRGVEDIELHHLDVVVVGKTPIARFTDTLEQYIFNVAPFTRNNPNFNLFYSLGGGAGAAGIISP